MAFNNGFRADKEDAMLGIVAFVLLILWAMGFLAFHVTTGFIHLLLILAVISLVAHLMTGRATV